MRRKSSGTTMVASPWRNALVRQKCEDSPAIATPSIGSACATSILVTKDGLLPTRFIGSCMAFIQNRIAKVVSVTISFLVAMEETAKPNAAPRMTSAAGWNASSPGRRITATPRKPSTTAPARLVVMRSRSSHAASKASQAGLVNSSANTVASGSKVMLSAQAYCAAKCTLLRSACVPMRRGNNEARSAGRAQASANRIARPAALRSARISNTLNVRASARIDTAMTENDSSTPLIHSMTRPMWALVTARFLSARIAVAEAMFVALECQLFRVRLVFGPRLLERGKLLAGGVGRDDAREFLERHVVTARVGDLGNEADVGEGDLGAERVGPRCDHRLDRLETGHDPMRVPSVDSGLVVVERSLEVLQHDEVVERMDVAGDRLGHGANLGAPHGIAGQQRWLPVRLLEIIDDGQRLGEHFAAGNGERRHPHLRVDAAVFGAPLLAACLREVDGQDLVAQSLEIERDAHPVGGGGAKIRIELQHGCSLQAGWRADAADGRGQSGSSMAEDRMGCNGGKNRRLRSWPHGRRRIDLGKPHN